MDATATPSLATKQNEKRTRNYFFFPGGGAVWRSKVPADYDELSTAELSTAELSTIELSTVELSEEASSPGDCELVSVVVTQPEMHGNSTSVAEHHLPADCVVQHGASKYTMEDLEEFLQSLEACLPSGTMQAFEQSSGLDMQTLLAAIASCPEMDFIGCFPSQVPRNSSPVCGCFCVLVSDLAEHVFY